jgi:hypothetical protein
LAVRQSFVAFARSINYLPFPLLLFRPDSYRGFHRLFLGVSSLCFGVGINELLDFTLLSVLSATLSATIIHLQTRYPLTSTTNLPLGELQIGLSTALSIETLSVLEGSANRARSNGKVFVVTVPDQSPPVSDCDRQERANAESR